MWLHALSVCLPDCVSVCVTALAVAIDLVAVAAVVLAAVVDDVVAAAVVVIAVVVKVFCIARCPQ